MLDAAILSEKYEALKKWAEFAYETLLGENYGYTTRNPCKEYEELKKKYDL